jgi:hypothetical protein
MESRCDYETYRSHQQKGSAVMDSAEAHRILDHAEGAADRVRGVARWYALYAGIYALASVTCALAVGLIANTVVSMTVFGVVWGTTMVGLTVYAARQRVAPPHFVRTHLLMILSWALAWILVVVGGPLLAPGSVTWYLPGALLTAVPPLVAAALVVRSTRGRQA